MSVVTLQLFYIVLIFTIEGKKVFLTDKVFFLCSLADDLRDFVHPSVDVYMAKNTDITYTDYLRSDHSTYNDKIQNS